MVIWYATPGGSMSSLNSALVSKNLPRPQSSFRPQDFHSQLELSPSPRTTLILTEISLVTSGFLVLVAQSYQTLCDHMDCNRPGSSVHGTLQAKILEWVAMPSSRGSSQLRDGTQLSHIAGRFFIIWATKEACGVYIYVNYQHTGNTKSKLTSFLFKSPRPRWH